VIGLIAALLPHAWIQIFSNASAVVDAGSAYLARVAPFYALFGMGMSLYFASQGAGRMAWPFTAGIIRLAVLLVAGFYWVEHLHGSLNGLYWIVAASYFVFGSINALALARGRGWGVQSARSSIAAVARRA
jgi:Na+-driven multidrug efflux pump